MAHSQPRNANTGQGVKGSCAVFHDFFGKGCNPDSSHISTTSDLASGAETSNRYCGSKRCNSDSIMGSCRDKFPRESSPRAMKLVQSGVGERERERVIRRAYDEDTSSVGVHPNPMRPLISQSSRWDRDRAVGPTLQYPPRYSSYQAPSSNRFRDGIAIAADEGSRTGIKGSPGILSSINATDRPLPGVPLSSCNHKSGIHISDPQSSTNVSQRGVTSTGRQMTIFYGGQAHVFDDVHSNKADIIMALAGSNGGSWSTSYAPKKSSIENCVENEMGMGMGLLRELQGKSSLRVGSSHASASADQISLPSGRHRGSVIAKEATTPVQTPQTIDEHKRQV